MSLAENWLAAEPRLVERLKAQVPELRGVFHAAADTEQVLAGQAKGAPVSPAVHVQYLGDVPLDVNGRGEATCLDQQWLVLLRISHFRDAGEGRRLAGALLPKIHSALAGWDAGIAGLRPFRRERAPAARYLSGHAVFPMVFSARAFL